MLSTDVTTADDFLQRSIIPNDPRYARQTLAARTELLRRSTRANYQRLGLFTGAAAAATGFMRLRSGKRYRPSAGFQRRVRFRGATSVASSRTNRPRPAGVQSGQGVTVQHDARRIYQRRRMPRRMKRRWKKFTRRVHAVSEVDLGSRTVVFNVSQQFINIVNTNHGLAYCGLYTANGAGDSWQRDLSTLVSLENTGNPTAVLGQMAQDTTKWIFKSAVLDITVRNTSFLSADPFPLNSAAKLEVDVYELISNRNWSDSAANYSDPTGAFLRGANITPNLLGAGTGISLFSRGATPWDLPAALSYFRLKILKKTKYFVNNGDTFTYQIRDPKRRVIMQEYAETIEGANLRGWTRHILIIFKAVPGIVVNSTTGTTEAITVGMTRKYFYKIEGFNEDRDRYIVG